MSRTSGQGVASDVMDVGFAWVIVELAPDGILVTDDAGTILMANRQVEARFGYDRDTPEELPLAGRTHVRYDERHFPELSVPVRRGGERCRARWRSWIRRSRP